MHQKTVVALCAGERAGRYGAEHGADLQHDLADLLRHGLLKAGFIQSVAIREVREGLRNRKTLVGERSQEINRLQKILESANIKPAVVSDILGVSGWQRLEALADGKDDSAVLAGFAKRVRAKVDRLQQTLEVRVKPHYRLLWTR